MCSSVMCTSILDPVPAVSDQCMFNYVQKIDFYLFSINAWYFGSMPANLPAILDQRQTELHNIPQTDVHRFVTYQNNKN